MRRNAQHDNRHVPYVYAYYNMEFLVPPKSSVNRSFLAHTLNKLMSFMNSKNHEHLPRYLVIVLDSNLITAANVFDYGVTRTLEDTLKWLLININWAVETRKEDLYSKRHGTIMQMSEPCLIWVTMLKRPEYSFECKTNALASKFNNILEGIIAGNKRSHILRIHVDHNSTNFDRIGNLTANGKYEYWKNFDYQMMEFDREKKQITAQETRR